MKPSNTARFANLEIGEDHIEFHSPEEAKLHVAKQLENLPGLGRGVESQEILDNVAAQFAEAFVPPPMEREMKLRELRAKMWAEEDRKQAERLAKRDPTPKWNGVDAVPAAKRESRRRTGFLKRLFRKGALR